LHDANADDDHADDKYGKHSKHGFS